ncbi:hypothetical protein CFK38_05355 [Brachybacterium vulturis]|uniref:MFS transporter n=1 Tax=Brachybacterium vulturis TaxID=2017484 RepID=A0A291GKZ3_9MICO|nr:MFS transporter [Brachybacterium vulturis]ATG51019.1 hypothetical protein CFK38_05355 [Brachybacterium vulturis]
MRRILLATLGESTGDDAVRTLLPLIAVASLGVGGSLLGVLNALPFLWYLCAHRQIGAAVDALGHRRAVLLGNGLRVLTVTTLILLLVTGHLSVLALLVLAATIGLGDALFTTGHSSMVPAVVGRERTADCYQRIEGISAVARVSSPAAVSALLRLASPALALGLGGAAYLFSLITLATMPHRRSPDANSPESAEASRSRAGQRPSPTSRPGWTVRRVLSTRGLSHLTLSTMLLNSAAMVSGTALVLFALTTLGLPTSTVALFTAAGALGALLGATFSTPLRTRLPTGGAKLCATAGVALSSLVIPAAFLLPAAQAVTIAVGELLVAACATASTIVGSDVPARLVPQQQLGRASAAIRLLTIGVMPVTSVLGGLLIAASSPVAALLGAAGLAATACLPLLRIRRWSPPPPPEEPA